MATTLTQETNDLDDLPHIRKLDNSAPRRWISKGIDDLKQSRLHSIVYGLIFTLAGLLLIWQGPSSPLFTLFMLSGFMLVGPLAAVGLYDISHRLEEGKPASLLHAISALRIDTFKLISFAAILGVILMLWTVVTVSIVNLFFGNTELVNGSWGALMNGSQSVPFIALFMLSGLVLAALVFTISVFTIPYISDKHVSVSQAISTSIRAVLKNPGVMARWAATLAVLITLGMGFFFIGLVIALPLAGHASWHAYRETVVDD